MKRDVSSVPGFEAVSESAIDRKLRGINGLCVLGIFACSLAGAFAVHASTVETSFESPVYEEGKSLEGVAGWKTQNTDAENEQGGAFISTEKSFVGTQSLKISQAAVVERSVPKSDVRFYDLEILPHYGEGSGTRLSFSGGVLIFEKLGSSGQIKVWQGVGKDPILIRGGISLQSDGGDGWLRVTARVDSRSKEWDLFLDGKPVRAKLSLAESGDRFQVSVSSEAPVFLDDYFESSESPLFEDIDNDGMPDAEEWIYGLNPGVDDREGDLDGDGSRNIEEFFAGTSARQSGAEEGMVLFVDNLNGDDANSGMSSQLGLGSEGPKASIKGAMSVANDGATIVIMKGTGLYEEGSRHAKGKRLTIKSMSPITIK